LDFALERLHQTLKSAHAHLAFSAAFADLKRLRLQVCFHEKRPHTEAGGSYS
jgi:hypothetical protein